MIRALSVGEYKTDITWGPAQCNFHPVATTLLERTLTIQMRVNTYSSEHSWTGVTGASPNLIDLHPSQ